MKGLEELRLRGIHLGGTVPPDLGRLTSLRLLDLSFTEISGIIPLELGQLHSLESLDLSHADLSGKVPTEFGDLENLVQLALNDNPKLAGSLPLSLTDLDLRSLKVANTDLCAPADERFQTWLTSIPNHRIPTCGPAITTGAYLTQTVQSFDFPVPLVAGEKALLRVFVTAGEQNSTKTMPQVTARFYIDGLLVHTEVIPRGDTLIPAEFDEGRLQSSANAEIPAFVIEPGLEMVVEIDPDGLSDTLAGIRGRIPETGRVPVKVMDVPPLDLTLVPFLWVENPDRVLLDRIAGLAPDDDLFWQTLNLLPVRDFNLKKREFVWTSLDPVVGKRKGYYA